MALDKKRFQIVPHPVEGVTLQELNTHVPVVKDKEGNDILVWRTLSHHADKGAAEKAAEARAKAKPVT